VAQYSLPVSTNQLSITEPATNSTRSSIVTSIIDAVQVSGSIVDLPSLSVNFPLPNSPEVFRDNISQALRTLLEDVYLVAVEGSEGAGKTTVLSHFAREHPNNAITLFISAANRLSCDSDLIRADIAKQVYWAATGEVLEPSRLAPDLLKTYHYELQRKAKQKKEIFYFLIDGLEELSSAARDNLLLQLQDILPVGIPQFRFILSGDVSLYSEFIDERLTAKSFPLTPFSLDEVRTFFSSTDITSETLTEINSVCRGLPGRLAEVRRAINKGVLSKDFASIDDSSLERFFEIDWRQVDPGNSDQQRILALLAHDSKPHSVADISQVLDVPLDNVRQLISLTNFLNVDSGETNVSFATSGLRRYAADKLKQKKAHIQKLLIKRLLSVPNSDNSILDLPEYMEDAAEYSDLLAILTPEHILQVLERGQTLSRVADAVKRGFRCAVKLGRDGDIFRFGLQKAIIFDLASSNIWESEVAALTALDREPEATALATNAVLREDRLQMLATLVHHIWLKGSRVSSELVDQIRLLIETLDYWSLGPRARSIASKLVCVDSDLATTLLRKAKWITESDSPDHAFAHATAMILQDVKDAQQRSQAIEALFRSQQSQKTNTLLEGVRVLAGRYSPEEVCANSKNVGTPEAQISTLRFWCVLNGGVPDADLVAVQGLTLALATPTTSIDTSLLADFSQALAGAPTPERSTKLIRILDGLRATAERLGPSVDFVRLQLSLAKAEVAIDRESSETRLRQLLDYVDRIADLPSRGESYAHLLACINDLSSRVQLTCADTLRIHSASELELVVLTLSELTADHRLALGGIICALAKGDLEKALDYTKIINTEARRDAILSDVVDAMIQSPVLTIDLDGLHNVCDRIVDELVRGEAFASIIERFSDEKGLNSSTVGGLLPIISELPKMAGSMSCCRSIVHAIKVLRNNAENQYSSLEVHLKGALRNRWQKIDMGWARIDAGYGITRDLASVDRPEAESIFSETETMKSEGRIAAPQGTSTFLSCLKLLSRAFSGLLPKHRETEADIETMASLIDIIPSYGERATVWADICMRATISGRSDLADKICSTYLQPAVGLIPVQDTLYRTSTLIRIAPALYKSQPTMCLESLDGLSADNRDSALLQTIRFLLRRRVPSDPYDSGSSALSDVSYETLLQVENLTSRLNTDWMIYVTAEEVADAIQSSKNRIYLTRPQSEDISRRFATTARNKLPMARQITHKGYRIVTLAQAARMRQTKPQDWQELIEEANGLDNISDRAFVLQVIAFCLPNNMSAQFTKLLESMQSDIAKIPWELDQIDRILGLADDVHGRDNLLCRELVKKTATVLHRLNENVEVQRRRMIDIAFRIDEEFAKKLIDEFDDDDAKRLARSQVQLLEIRRSISEAKGRPNDEPGVKHLRSSEISKLGSMLLRSLSCGRFQHFHPSEIRDYVELASNQTLNKALPMLSWYIENAVVRCSNTDQAGAFLRPLFEACVLGSQLAGQISGKALIRLTALRNKTAELSSSHSLLVSPRSRTEAMLVLSRWFERELADEVKIHDQYFSPTDVEWLQLIRTAKSDCVITVMTSRKHQPEPPSGENLEDVYETSWRQLYDQTPPKAEIAVIGGEKSKESPIHDRWLISGASGLRFGTSLNSLGITKESDVSQMSETDVESRRREIDQYLNREKTEYEGEKLRLMRFWL
jgi:hypothetical protein